MASRFEIATTPISGLALLRTLPIVDGRGKLERLFCANAFADFIPQSGIRQINHTITKCRGTVRGMHFQYPPHDETKCITCLRGAVFDVAVDLRTSSPSYLQWYGMVLSPENHQMLIIPSGCAHGFQALTDDCELIYFHTAEYSAAAEGGLNPLDPAIAIAWPLPVVHLSERDASHPMISASFTGVSL